MRAIIPKLAVSGIATALPATTLNFTALNSQFGENEIKRVVGSTGIKQIHYADKSVKASDLCCAAAENLFKHLAINRNEIDALVFVSQTPDFIMPATSATLQHRLNLKTDVVAFDINYGCSGYIYALYQAALLIVAGGCKKVLLLVGDTITQYVNPRDRNVKLVFGDAGTATIIEKGSDEFAFTIKTDGSGANHLKIDNSTSHLFMDGAEVMAFALREVPKIVEDLLSLKQWAKADVDKFIFHQANTFMLNYLRKKLSLNKLAVPIAVETVGNTGPASIPLALSLTQGINKESFAKVVLCGFGVGLSWGAAGLDLSSTLILPPVFH